MTYYMWTIVPVSGLLIAMFALDTALDLAVDHGCETGVADDFGPLRYYGADTTIDTNCLCAGTDETERIAALDAERWPADVHTQIDLDS